jgi:hypothetical protein
MTTFFVTIEALHCRCFKGDVLTLLSFEQPYSSHTFLVKCRLCAHLGPERGTQLEAVQAWNEKIRATIRPLAQHGPESIVARLMRESQEGPRFAIIPQPPEDSKP